VPVVPEPEFKRFVFPKRGSVVETVPASRTQQPRTLEELGVPAPFAAELESTFRAMGALDGDRVTGFTFRTPDGVSHQLRTATVVGAKAGKAA
jgi:hypothetical protein